MREWRDYGCESVHIFGLNMVVKRIVCLAKSNREGGYCVAGKVLDHGRIGPWIRPIGTVVNDAVAPDTCRFDDGTEMGLLDIVEVRLISHVPSDHQRENWTFDESVAWRRLSKLNRQHVGALVDAKESTLWDIGCSSSSGRNDCVETADAQGISDSLRLVHVEELTVVVDDYPSDSGVRRRVQGRFTLGRNDYAMWIKDEKCESFYADAQPQEATFRNRYLAISLAKDYEGRCYKLIAGII